MSTVNPGDGDLHEDESMFTADGSADDLPDVPY